MMLLSFVPLGMLNENTSLSFFTTGRIVSHLGAPECAGDGPVYLPCRVGGTQPGFLKRL